MTITRTGSQNLAAIQALRCLAAVLVVVFHSELAIKFCRNDYWVPGDDAFRAAHYPFWANHLGAGVDIFFCISGFIMCMLAARAGSGEAFAFLRDRAVRILPPYWFFTSLIVAIWLIKPSLHLGDLSGNFWQDLPDIVRSFLLMPQAREPILKPGWTLVQEFCFYDLVFLVILLGRGRQVVHVLGVAAALGLVLWLGGVKILHGYFLSPFYIEFFLGALAFHLYPRLSKLWPEAQCLLAFSLYFIVSAVLDQHPDGPSHIAIQAAGFGIMGFVLISGSLGVYEKYRCGKNRFFAMLSRIGDASYSLYLSHWFVLSALGRLAGLYKAAPLPLLVAWQVLSIVTAIIVAVVFAERVELPLHRRLSQALKSRKAAKPAHSPSTGTSAGEQRPVHLGVS